MPKPRKLPVAKAENVVPDVPGEEIPIEPEFKEDEPSSAVAPVVAPDPPAAVVAEEPAVDPMDPNTDIGLDNGPSGAYVYATAPEWWDHDRSMTIAGAVFEHVAEDANGVWLYRIVR